MPATPTLRLTQTSIAPGQHQVQLALNGAGRPQTATARFAFQLADQDREDLRWYLEDYLEYPIDPAPAIAGRVEQRMAEVGRELFTGIFDSREGWSAWDKIHDRLHQTRIEVVSDVEAARVLPWELLRDPRTDNPLALDAHTFVRTEHETAKHPDLGAPGGKTIRVLLVICRPAGANDVPFRSVASHLVRLSAQARETFQLDVLRPPTFRQLATVLRAAADRGQPYHVVHFDGHGTWSTPSGSASRPLAGRRQGRGIPPRPTGGPGWCWLPTPSCAWPARPPTTSGCREGAPTPAATVTLPDAPRVSAAVVRPRLAGCHAETRRALPRPAQGPLLGTCRAVPGDQEARQEAPQEAAHDPQSSVSSSSWKHTTN
jgi:hypothetical protein